MAIARWKTAGDIINTAAVELNLGSVSDPFGSTDQNFILLVSLLNSTGQELTRKVKPLREATLTIASNDTGLYSLPDDFVGMKDQSGWNRTNVQPLIGPATSQEWQALKARNISGNFYARFRLVNGQMELGTPLPAVGTILAIEYITKAWVQSSGATDRDKDAATVTTDTVLYDHLLMEKALKFRWKASKGFEASLEMAEWLDLRDSVISDELGAPVLDAGAGTTNQWLIGDKNVPWTGYGQ